MKKEFLINTIISSVACLISIVALIFALIPNNGTDGKDGITPTIEISDDGYLIINGEKNDVCFVEKSKEFVVGEEIVFGGGEQFTINHIYYKYDYTGYMVGTVSDPHKITSAKLVAVEEIPLADSSKWPSKVYDCSYKYRLYVTGYAPKTKAGKQFNQILVFRTDPYTTIYAPRSNYESSTIGKDGYFEFSVDVYTTDIVTKVVPERLIDY